jgi:hypothetical protein
MLTHSDRYRICSTPVLILLLVDWTVWVPLHADVRRRWG